MWWKILLPVGGAIGGPLLTFFISRYIPNRLLARWGIAHGEFLSNLMRTKLGHAVENAIESVAQHYLGNLIVGLRKDNIK